VKTEAPKTYARPFVGLHIVFEPSIDWYPQDAVVVKKLNRKQKKNSKREKRVSKK
jgi:hypothetical protein